jgi:hypothetical protein
MRTQVTRITDRLAAALDELICGVELGRIRALNEYLTDEHLADYPIPCTLTPEAERLMEAEAVLEAGI